MASDWGQHQAHTGGNAAIAGDNNGQTRNRWPLCGCRHHTAPKRHYNSQLADSALDLAMVPQLAAPHPARALGCPHNSRIPLRTFRLPLRNTSRHNWGCLPCKRRTTRWLAIRWPPTC